MPAQVNITTSPALLGNGLQTAIGDPLGSQYVSELHSRYYGLARAGLIYTSYVSAVATSLPATSTIGNLIWNAPGSGCILVMLKWTSQIVATSATCTGIAIAGGFQTTTPTSLTAATSNGNTIVSAITRVPDPTSVTASVATVLTAPVVIQVLHHNTAAIATTGEDIITGDLEGSIVVPEGGFVTLCALGAAAAASGHTSSLMYARIPTR